MQREEEESRGAAGRGSAVIGAVNGADNDGTEGLQRRPVERAKTISQQDELKAAVRRVYAQVKSDREKWKYEQLQTFLSRERDQVQQVTQRPPPTQIDPEEIARHVVSSNSRGGAARQRFQITQKASTGADGEIERSTSSVPVQTLSPPTTLPGHLVFLPMQRNLRVPDKKDLSFVPYLGENRDNETEDILSDHELARRHRLVEEGAQSKADDTNEFIDKVLQRCTSLQFDNDDVWTSMTGTSIVLAALTDCFHLSDSRIQGRYSKLMRDLRVEAGKGASADNTTESETAAVSFESRETSASVDDSDTRDRAYLDALDSYRAMYCRQCFTFQCNIHGIYPKPSLDFQSERAREKIDDGAWPSIEKDSLLVDPVQSFSEVKELSKFHKMICKRLFLIHEGDVEEMSISMRAPVSLIQDFVDSEGYSLPSKLPSKRKSKGKPAYYSVSNYKHKWYAEIEKAVIHPLFEPCLHEGICSEANCSCVMSRHFCTPACCWGSRSPNFYRGCCCKGACNAKSCTCYATKRECDPDLCGCNTCCDPPGEPAETQMCRNDNIRMRRQAHLLLAPSRISGWGLFTKYALKKGDFVHSYVGELVSQEEAERRGQVDDIKNRSYLFNLSSDYVIDACRKGNKSRFINHSDNPNCETRTLFVNGDQSIGFFASVDIKAECELFFNYRYNESMQNELIDKSAKTFDWMKAEEKERKPAGKYKKKTSKKRKR